MDLLRPPMADDDTDRKIRIGRRIRELRMESPYTQEAIAQEIGVSLRGYQAMEGRGAVSFASLEKIAALHKKDLDYFYREDSPPALERAVELLEENQELMREILRRLAAVAPPLTEEDGLQAARQVVVDARKARRAPKRGTAKRAPSSPGSRPASG